MSPGKVATQCVHAALGLQFIYRQVSPCMIVVVLSVSDKKFAEAKGKHKGFLIADAGYTEIAPGTETAFAYTEPDLR
jgi:peptidyl-tRNA hydrolase